MSVCCLVYREVVVVNRSLWFLVLEFSFSFLNYNFFKTYLFIILYLHLLFPARQPVNNIKNQTLKRINSRKGFSSRVLMRRRNKKKQPFKKNSWRKKRERLKK